MRAPDSSLLVALCLLVASAGCAAPAEEETSTGGNQAFSESQDSLVANDYALSNATMTGSLHITSIAPFAFSLSVQSKVDGAVGLVPESAARVVNGIATFQEGSCRIALTPGDGSVALLQTGTCDGSASRIGLPEDASGTYRPKAAR